MDRLLTTTDARGNRVSNRYDAFGNRVEQTRGQSVLSGFDVAHASTLTFKYDGAGRMIERENPTTHGLVRITYDAAGNQTEIKTLQSGTVDTVSAVWTTQTMQYDGNGRVIRNFDSFSTRTDYFFDAVGNLTSIVFAANDTTLQRTFASEYDLDNNKTATIDALLNRTDVRLRCRGQHGQAHGRERQCDTFLLRRIRPQYRAVECPQLPDHLCIRLRRQCYPDADLDDGHRRRNQR